MYGKVATSFFKLLICYCLFIVAFSIGFYIGFHNDVGDQKLEVDSLTQYVFFDSQFETFIKIMAMFVGEVDFNNIHLYFWKLEISPIIVFSPEISYVQYLQ